MAGGHAWQGCVHGRGYMAVGACMTGGVCGRGPWKGVCVAGGMHGRGTCTAGGACTAGGVHGRGVCGRYYEIRSMSGRYASYWNAFLS